MALAPREGSTLDKLQKWEVGQAKTFTRWCNCHLRAVGDTNMLVQDVSVDFGNGVRLIKLVEILKGTPLGKYREEPKNIPHIVENLNTGLNPINTYLKEQKKHLHYSAENIMNKDLTLILGMVWTLISLFSLDGVTDEDKSAKEALLIWCHKKVVKYGLQAKNFTKDWQDGKDFCALIHRHRPELIPNMDQILNGSTSPEDNMEQAFQVAEQHLGIPRLLDPEDVIEYADEKSIMTYLTFFWKAFASMASGETAARRIAKMVSIEQANEAAQASYGDRARALLDKLSSRTDDFQREIAVGECTLEEIQRLLKEYTEFKKGEKMAMAAEKGSVEQALSSIQTKMKSTGRPSYDPPPDVSVSLLGEMWLLLCVQGHTYEDMLQSLLAETVRLARVKSKSERVAAKYTTVTSRILQQIRDNLAFYQAAPVLSGRVNEALAEAIRLKAALSQYRRGEKLQLTRQITQTKTVLAGLQGTLKFEGCDPYTPPEGLTQEGLSAAWAELEAAEAAYGESLEKAIPLLEKRAKALGDLDDRCERKIKGQAVAITSYLQDEEPPALSVAQSASKVSKLEYYEELLLKSRGSLEKVQAAAHEHALVEATSKIDELHVLLAGLEPALDARRQQLEGEAAEQERLDMLRLKWSEKAEALKVWAAETLRDLEAPFDCYTLTDVEKLEEQLNATVADVQGKQSSDLQHLAGLSNQCNTAMVPNPYTELTVESANEAVNRCVSQLAMRGQALRAERAAQEHHNALRKAYADKAAMFDSWCAGVQQRIVACGEVGEESEIVLERLTSLKGDMEAGKALLDACEAADKDIRDAGVGLNNYTERSLFHLLQEWMDTTTMFADKQKSLESYIALKKNIQSGCARYMDRAGPLMTTITSKQAEFENSAALASLALPGALELDQAMKDWRKGQKVQLLNEKGAVESILTGLQAKTKQAGFAEYSGDEGHRPEDIAAAWEAMVAVEKDYAATVAEALARLQQDEQLRQTITKKVDSLEAGIASVSANIDSLTLELDTSANCVSIAEQRWKDLTEFDEDLIKLSADMAALEALVDRQFQTQPDSAAVGAKVADLSTEVGPMSHLNSILAEKADTLENNLAAAQALDDKRLKFANQAEDFRQQLETANEELTQPLYCNSSADVEKLQAALEAKRQELADLRRQMADIGYLFSETFCHREGDNPYSSVSMEVLGDDFAATEQLLGERQRTLHVEAEKQASFNQMRQQFADVSDAFMDWCSSVKEKLTDNRKMSALDPSHQLDSVVALGNEVASGEARLREVERQEDALKEAHVIDNPLAKHTLNECQSEYELVQGIVAEKRTVLEAAIAEHSEGLSSDQTAEFRKMFDHFDIDKDGKLKVHEIKAVLASLDIDMDDAKILSMADPATKTLDFERFVQFFSELLKDVDTYDQIVESFKALCSSKPTITHADLDKPLYSEFLDAPKVAYLEAHMAQDEQGGYDYVSYTGTVYGKVARPKEAGRGGSMSSEVQAKVQAARLKKEKMKEEAKRKAEEEERRREEEAQARAEEEARLLAEAKAEEDRLQREADQARQVERERAPTLLKDDAAKAAALEAAKGEASMAALMEVEEDKAAMEKKQEEEKARRAAEDAAREKAEAEAAMKKAKAEEDLQKALLAKKRQAGLRGPLWKKGGSSGSGFGFHRRNWTKREFVLDSTGVLAYYKDKKALDELQPSGTITLNPTTVVRFEDPHGDKVYCFAIEGPELEGVFIMCADTPVERAGWMEMFSLWTNPRGSVTSRASS